MQGLLQRKGFRTTSKDFRKGVPVEVSPLAGTRKGFRLESFRLHIRYKPALQPLGKPKHFAAQARPCVLPSSCLLF